MKKITLKTINHRIEEQALDAGKTIVKKAELGTKYQLLNENEQLIQPIKTQIIDNDLLIFLESTTQPSLLHLDVIDK